MIAQAKVTEFAVIVRDVFAELNDARVVFEVSVSDYQAAIEFDNGR